MSRIACVRCPCYSSSVARKMRQMLAAVVSKEGTAAAAAIDGVPLVATGTLTDLPPGTGRVVTLESFPAAPEDAIAVVEIPHKMLWARRVGIARKSPPTRSALMITELT